MSLIKVDTVRDMHGNGHSVVTERCDGPDCGKTIRSNERDFQTWGSLIGFVTIEDDDLSMDDLTGNWCSRECLKAWAAAL